jgi:hypothetical protein
MQYDSAEEIAFAKAGEIPLGFAAGIRCPP